MTTQAHIPIREDHPAARVRDKRWRVCFRGRFAFWLCIGVAVSLFLQSYLRNKNTEDPSFGRKLLESSECTSQPRWIEKGGVVLYVIGLCYMFVGITIICDDYFVSSLEKISGKLNLSGDVAGATFMAAGSSAPELFTSFVSLTNDRVSNDVEVGTIVRSALFNMLVIIGMSAIFSGRELNLDYRPVVRDCLFYLVAIIGVIAVFCDGKIYWWEGLIFVFLYGLYILTMKFNKAIMDMLPPPRSRKFRNFNADGLDLDALPYEHSETSTSDEEMYHERKVDGNMEPLLPTTKGEITDKNTTSPEQDDLEQQAKTTILKDNAQESEDDRNPFTVPDCAKDRLTCFLFLPWTLMFYYTVPDCSKVFLSS